MTFFQVKLEIREPIAVLTLNRPEVLNSLNVETAQEARRALAAVRENSAIRALIVTGAGRAFCAGAELDDNFSGVNSESSVSDTLNENMQEHFNPWVRDIESLPIPVIAAVNGVAVGAGVGIALAADITIAAQSASFILSFAPKLGLIPDLGSSWQIPRRIGLARARGLALLGNKLTAEKALEWGLIWECVSDEQLFARAEAIALQLSHLPSHIPEGIRATLNSSTQSSLTEQLDYERIKQCEYVSLPSFSEGVQAFREKRRPNFRSEN